MPDKRSVGRGAFGLLFVFLAGASAAWPHQGLRLPGGGEDDRGLDLLVRSMRGDFHVNVIATMAQRVHRRSNLFERIKVLRSKSGRQHWTVVEPLSLAGTETVDDGRRWQTYVPDERLLIDQESPMREEADLRARIKLAKHNYIFRTEAHADIAGRSVVCVTAMPRAEALEGRRYCLDLLTSYPLRMETVSHDGDATLVYDIKDVQFPDQISAGAFEMHPLPGFSRITYERPRSVSPHEAMRLVGFKPIVPSRLTLGFQVQEMQYSKSPEWRSIVVRLTDGLARANVYEWLPDGKPKKPMADSTPGETHGIKLLIVSDNLDSDAREELLGAFTDEE